MPPYITHRSQRDVARNAVGPDPARRADLTAALAVALVVVLLLAAQLTLALSICFVIAGRVSRWRPSWLAVPAVSGIAWVLAIGLRQAAGGYLAIAGKLIAGLTHGGALSVGLARLPGSFAAWPRWLPGQFPVALVAAAAIALALGRPKATQAASCRPGALVFLRSRYLAATLRRGELATADGCCLGVVGGTGRKAAVSWAEVAGGMLCTGAHQTLATSTGLDLAIAAIQHRKTVVVIDLVAQDALLAQGAALLAACADVAAPLHRFGQQSSHYDPLGDPSPARVTSLVMAMIDWAGVPHADQLFCANYLNAALSLIAMTASTRSGLPDGLLTELVRLLEPGALQASLARLGERQATSLSGKVAELVSRVEGGCQAQLAARLAALDSSALGRWLRSAGTAISFGRCLDRREVAYFPLGELRHAGPVVMLARLAVADLVDNLARRSDAGVTADCLVWINGCEAIDSRQLRALLALGERTGTAVVLGTASGPVVAGLASEVNVVSARGAFAPGQAALGDSQALAELAPILEAAAPDELTLSVRRPPRITRCVAVR